VNYAVWCFTPDAAAQQTTASSEVGCGACKRVHNTAGDAQHGRRLVHHGRSALPERPPVEDSETLLAVR